MPYTLKTLPDSVKNALPKKAQEIFLKAVNNAFDEYQDRKNTEELAFKVAWSAVKKVYEQNEEANGSKRSNALYACPTRRMLAEHAKGGASHVRSSCDGLCVPSGRNY